LTDLYNQTNFDAWNAANLRQSYATPLAWLLAYQAGGTLDQADGLQIQQGGSSVASNALNAEKTGVVCFAQSTRIRVPGGEMPVEMLWPGDLIQHAIRAYSRLFGLAKEHWTMSTLQPL
jgi:hypothetical protein